MIRDTINNGYSLPFFVFPKTYFLSNNRSSLSHAEFVSQEVSNLVKIGSVVQVGEQPFGVNPLTVAVQGSGKKRLILDCSYLNNFLVTYKFKLEHVQFSLPYVKPGWFMAKLDLKSGYHHVHINLLHQKYLGFCWEGLYYQYRVLPFGVSTAPFLFTKLLRPLLSKWREMGIPVFCYIDDLLIFSMFEDLMYSQLLIIINDLDRCGFVLNVDKCVLKPVQEVEYLGFVLNTEEREGGYVSITDKKWESVKSRVTEAIRAWPRLCVRKILGVAGTLMSLRLVLGEQSMIFTRSIYRATGGCSNLDTPVQLNSDVLCELKHFDSVLCAKPVLRLGAKQVYNGIIETDASCFGWGGILRMSDENMWPQKAFISLKRLKVLRIGKHLLFSVPSRLS